MPVESEPGRPKPRVPATEWPGYGCFYVAVAHEMCYNSCGFDTGEGFTWATSWIFFRALWT
jgi:hypothetical protein